MTDQLRSVVSPFYHLDQHADHEPFLALQETFTRSNGTLIARIYERLTKASRRRTNSLQPIRSAKAERVYRLGVKDALEALRAELS